MSIRGVYSAAATPLNEDLSPDHAALAAHCRHLLDDGCHGVALLGSTGEANSFSADERRDMLEAVVKSGIAPDALLPGTGLCALPETIALTRHALSIGVTKVVMLPPFYYKGVSDQGLFDAYSQVIDAVADDRLRVILYHIPLISQVPLSHDLIARLLERYPGTIAGIKDSGGQLDHMQSLVQTFPQLSVLAGADPFLLPLMGQGGSGCITATSNLASRQLRTVFDKHADSSAAAEIAAAQARIVALREASNSFAQIPTIKAMIARRYNAPGWRRMRAPLVSLTEEQATKLHAVLHQVDLDHPA
jgi:4-hydroxy-tetrahydrodipicolinate synthase